MKSYHEMTREEVLLDIAERCGIDIDSNENVMVYDRDKMAKFKKWLFEELENADKEPCEDAVSRKAVLNLARDLEFGKIKGMENYKHRCIEIEDVEELPSVMPDLSSLREINEALTKRVQFLETMNRYATPVTPTRKKGKWIEETYNGRKVDVCSNCQHIMHKEPTWHFCPLCGADMREVEE